MILIALILAGCSPLSDVSKEKGLKVSFAKELQPSKLIHHLKVLSADNMAGRRFSSPESNIAQTYIVSELVSSGVHPFQGKYRHSFTHKTYPKPLKGSNIVGFVKGSKFPEQYIVLSAHYDLLGTKGSKIYNGADDNASGTATVLAFANAIAMKPLQHSIIFLFSDGEEVNLLGTKAFVKQQAELLPQIKLNINLDMIAGSVSTRKLHYIEGRLHTILPNAREHMSALSNKAPMNIKRGFKEDNFIGSRNYKNASDHGVFNRLKIPFIYFGVGEHKNYHTTHDDFEHVNKPFFVKASQSIFSYLVSFDMSI